MINWLQLALGAIRLVNYFLDRAHDAGLIDQGRKDAILKGMQESQKEIELAKAARLRVRTELGTDDTKLHDDDGFKRD